MAVVQKSYCSGDPWENSLQSHSLGANIHYPHVIAVEIKSSCVWCLFFLVDGPAYLLVGIYETVPQVISMSKTSMTVLILRCNTWVLYMFQLIENYTWQLAQNLNLFVLNLLITCYLFQVKYKVVAHQQLPEQKIYGFPIPVNRFCKIKCYVMY